MRDDYPPEVDPETEIAKLLADGAVRRCSWQGYGFGAHYQDAGCVDGFASNIDDYDAETNAVGRGEEPCPNCMGKGVVQADHVDRGPMALIRARAQWELCDDIMELASDDDGREFAAELCRQIEGLFGLVRKLEEA